MLTRMPPEPGREPVALPERPEPQPRLDDRVVGRVLGLPAIAEDDAGEAVGAVKLGGDEAVERRVARIRRGGSLDLLGHARLTIGCMPNRRIVRPKRSSARNGGQPPRANA